MGFKKLVSMNIAVIGDTATAFDFAQRFAHAGHNIMMAIAGQNDFELPMALCIYDNITTSSIAGAAAAADMIILATPPRQVREASYWLGDVRRKVIVDATANEHVPDAELVKTACAIKAITGSPHVVKIFNTSGYENLLKPLFNGAHVDLILLSDSLKAKEITKIMAIELGMSAFYDFGGSEHIALFNEMTRCWRNLKKVSDTASLVTKL